jgi:hypothetical protein
MVPEGGRASFADIAKQTPLSESAVTRLVRYAMTFRVFCEPEPGMVAHTKASRSLTDVDMNGWLRAGTEEMWLASTKMVEAFTRWPDSQEPAETGFCLANDTPESIYQVLGAQPERAVRFGNAMAVYAKRPENDLAYLTDHYDWASLGRATVVDLGGARGHVSMAIASKFPDLNMIVQDMPPIIAGAASGVPE